MMKTYAAPIAEEQVQPIVQYLMAAKEKGAGPAWETPAAIMPPQIVPEEAIARRADREHGRALYRQNCASCHGADGRSNTPAAATQLPRPSDLTSGLYSQATIAASITHGVPGTAMPAAAIHSGSDVNDLVAYVIRLQPPVQSPAPATSDEGKTLFAKNCTACHGVHGMGDGIAAPPLARAPANFHERQPTREQALRVITDGVPGTAMAAWKSRLTDSQRAALAEYVRTFYAERR
jgi:cbb3-type cytochrome c oxidase subunit III